MPRKKATPQAPAADDTDTLIPAVVYYRMSSDKQDTSIPQQKKRVEAHFGNRYRIVEVYIDQGKSGSKDTDKRTAFLKMIHDLCEGKHKGKVKYILCFDQSRFGRLDTLEGAEHKKALRKARVKLATVVEGLIDWNTMTGRLMDSVLAESHHAFARLVGEKGLGGRINNVKEGQFSGGSIPYGCYKKVTDDKGNESTIKRTDQFSKPKSWRSTLVPGDVEEVKAVKWLYKQFDTRDVSYRQLAMEAEAKGFPSPTETGWRGQFVEAILTNHAYVGDAVIGKKSDGEFYRHHDGEVKPVEEVEGKQSLTIYRDAYTPLIGRELWDRVQAKIARKEVKQSKPQKDGGYPLTGILYCGNCGKTLVANRSPSGLVRYQCKNASANPSLGCKYWLAHERELLPFILEKLIEHMDAAALEALASEPPPASNSTADIARLQKKLTALVKKIEQGRENFLIAPKSLTQGLAYTLEKWEAERVSLENEIRTAQVAGDDTIKEWLRQQAAWWDEMKGKLIEVKTGESVTVTNHWIDKTTVEVEVPMEAATLRELLHKLNAKVWLWFVLRRDGSKGREIDRGRFKAEVGNQVYYDGPSTEPRSQLARDKSDMSDRNAFLDRVRQAVAAGNRAGATPTLPSRGSVGHQGAGTDIVQRFCAELTAAGGQPYVVKDAASAAQRVLELVEACAARRVLVGRGPILDTLNLPQRLGQRGLDVALVEHATGRDTFFQADIAISGVAHAVAETGSLVMASSPAEPRSLSLLPPIHIAVVAASQLLPDLFDLFADLELAKSQLPASLSLITGPSKTGDIELKLVTGVHGPGEVHVIVIQE